MQVSRAIHARKLAASAMIMIVAFGVLHPISAVATPAASPDCGVLAPQSRVQSDHEYALAQRALADYCASRSVVQPFGVNYGTYIRLETTSKRVCTCEPYKAWYVQALATGVPYDGSHLSDLVLLWRTSPTAAWKSATAPVDTWNRIERSGTMSTTSTIYAVATLYNYWATKVDGKIYSQAT